MLGRTPCFAAFPEEAALCRSDNYIMTGSTDPGCPQVLPGILIAKMAIWGLVLAASGHFAKLQSEVNHVGTSRTCWRSPVWASHETWGPNRSSNAVTKAGRN